MELDLLSNLGLSDKVDFAIVLIYLLGGVFAKKYVTIGKISTTYKVLITGTLLSFIYVGLMYLDGVSIPLAKILLSYALATTLYDLIIKKIKNKMNITEENTTENTCSECPLLNADAFYGAKEITEDELQNIVSQDVISQDVILYCNEYIYIPIILESGQIDLQSNYVGARPPSKPVRR